MVKFRFKPWLSPREVFASAPMNEIPRPSFWKQEFNELGYEILFRCYSGEGKQSQQIPYPDYSGYFIQLADKIKETQTGLFIRYVSMEDNIVNLSFFKYEENLDPLWISLTAILAGISNVKISCGNCEFSGEQWKQLLKDGKYPQTD